MLLIRRDLIPESLRFCVVNMSLWRSHLPPPLYSSINTSLRRCAIRNSLIRRLVGLMTMWGHRNGRAKLWQLRCESNLPRKILVCCTSNTLESCFRESSDTQEFPFRYEEKHSIVLCTINSNLFKAINS